LRSCTPLLLGSSGINTSCHRMQLPFRVQRCLAPTPQYRRMWPLCVSQTTQRRARAGVVFFSRTVRKVRLGMEDRIEFRVDDLCGEPTRRLIESHLKGMYASSPAESVHAFSIEKLRQPGVTFWSVWVGDEIAGCGALKRLDDSRGEIKSMRVADQFLGRGIGRAILRRLLEEARRAG